MKKRMNKYEKFTSSCKKDRDETILKLMHEANLIHGIKSKIGAKLLEKQIIFKSST